MSNDLTSINRQPGGGDLLTEERDSLLADFMAELDSSEMHRRGFVSALGAFPAFALRGRVGDVLERIIACTEVAAEADREKWAEARRDSVNAIMSIVRTLGVSKEQGETSIGSSTLVRLYECFIAGLGDYTMDRRGDIGAWVREACMVALHDATALVMASADGPALADDLSVCVRRFMPLMAQQAVEKIDRTRGLAAKLFADLVFHQPPVPGIPAMEQVPTKPPSSFSNIGSLLD